MKIEEPPTIFNGRHTYYITTDFNSQGKYLVIEQKLTLSVFFRKS